MRRLALSLLLLSGCVSGEQYRSLAASYESYYNLTHERYLQSIDAEVEMPASVKASKHHDVEAAGLAVAAAKKATQ